MKSAWAQEASVVAAVVASACCGLPFVLLALGFSAAGVSVAFAAVRPLFLTLSSVLLVLAFLLHFARQHACAPGSLWAEPSAREKRLSRLGLLLATALVLLVGLFPDYSGLITGSRQRAVGAAEAGTRITMTLMIEGMTCAACTVDVQQALAALPGVKDVSVHYPEGHAVITSVRLLVMKESVWQSGLIWSFSAPAQQRLPRHSQHRRWEKQRSWLSSARWGARV